MFTVYSNSLIHNLGSGFSRSLTIILKLSINNWVVFYDGVLSEAGSADLPIPSLLLHG